MALNTWGVVRELYPNGICDGLYAYHSSDLNNHIGIIEVSNYYNNSEQHKIKYGITSINIEDGRYQYGGEGSHKYSIHSKNIVRVAKKSFKPFTFDQIADRNRQKFAGKINGIANSMRWELRQNICDGYEHFIDDLENLPNIEI